MWGRLPLSYSTTLRVSRSTWQLHHHLSYILLYHQNTLSLLCLSYCQQCDSLYSSILGNDPFDLIDNYTISNVNLGYRRRPALFLLLDGLVIPICASSNCSLLSRLCALEDKFLLSSTAWTPYIPEGQPALIISGRTRSTTDDTWRLC